MNKKDVHDLKDFLIKVGINESSINIVHFPATNEYKLETAYDLMYMSVKINSYIMQHLKHMDTRAYSISFSKVTIE